jgi:hypothetical protein
MCRTLVVSTIMLTSLVACTPAVAARAGRKVTPKCPPADEGVVVADAQAVLYKATTTVYESEEHKFVEGQQEIFGCAYGAKRSYHIGLPPYGGTGGSGGVDPVALVGPIVAYDVGENAGIEGVTEAHSSHEIWVRKPADRKADPSHAERIASETRRRRSRGHYSDRREERWIGGMDRRDGRRGPGPLCRQDRRTPARRRFAGNRTQLPRPRGQHALLDAGRQADVGSAELRNPIKSVRSSLCVWSMTGFIIAIGISGCGGGSTAKISTSDHVRTARLAPAYRAGQYCVASGQAKYRAAGFVCEKHHLARS